MVGHGVCQDCLLLRCIQTDRQTPLAKAKAKAKRNANQMADTFKIQAHAMFLDTSHNSLGTVLSNIHSAFYESASKMWTYARCMPAGKQPGTRLLIKTVEDLINLAFVLVKSKGKNRKNSGYSCAVSKVQVEWYVFLKNL